jgi:hypothetical protein
MPNALSQTLAIEQIVVIASCTDIEPQMKAMQGELGKAHLKYDLLTAAILDQARLAKICRIARVRIRCAGGST